MKSSSGPSRESTWGMIFLAAVPMLIMSFVVLIKKKMPFVGNAAVLKPGIDPIFAKRRVELWWISQEFWRPPKSWKNPVKLSRFNPVKTTAPSPHGRHGLFVEKPGF